ncbi:MAG: LysM peptidoglycan-binding domain-containing protein [Anaerolineales bacterium]|nr:LysM peptidoglycan-binding domain-containing protein [Anaerolineales bacterium]
MILMFIMAIILGIGGFLAVTYLAQRPDTPAEAAPGSEGTFTVVEGVEVQVVLDANKTVDVIGPVDGQRTVEVAPTQPPEQPVVVVQAEEQPTAVQLTPIPQPTATFVPPTPVPEKVILIDYIVPANASLYEVASRIDTSIALMALYGLSAEDLVPGTTIRLPIGNAAYCPGRRPYAVGEGDTAYSIGRRFGISAEQLQQINNLNADFRVDVADILCVP